MVLPESRGRLDAPGKYADLAIPAMLAELNALPGRKPRGRLSAVLVGGASMFRTVPGSDVGRLNQEASDRVLKDLGIPVIARDTGGSTGRNVTLDTASGRIQVRVPGGPIYDL